MSLASCAFVGTSSITDPSAGISLSKGRRLHHLGLQCSLLRHVSSQSMQHRLYVCNAAADGDEVPNWDEEMSIFKKRTMKPSQLAALRTWEENKVDLGTVSYYISRNFCWLLNFFSTLCVGRLGCNLFTQPPSCPLNPTGPLL